MNDLEITTAIACFALVLAVFGFFIGAIYNSKQIEKLKEQLDKEVRGVNRQLGLLNNSVYGNFENNRLPSNESKVISELVAEHGNKLAHISHVIDMLIEHTKCDALKGYKI